MSNISKELANKLSVKFNILDTIRLHHYYHDWKLFVERINKTRKTEFSNNDRYLIDHSDTDYYLPHCPYGLTIFNFARTCLYEDIPLHTFIIITNVNGLSQEFDILLPNNSNKPTIVENCITGFTNMRFNTKHPTFDHKETEIIRHGVSMMGLPRSHRHALYNELKKRNLLDKYAISHRVISYKEHLR